MGITKCYRLPGSRERRPCGSFIFCLLATLLFLFGISTSLEGQTFAVIGDFGIEGEEEEDVANLVMSWSPDFIITTGDNNYPDGAASTIDPNIGQYYHGFIYPYLGSYGPGAETNRFFPSLGNHDVVTNNGQPYLDYFTLPGNERYYDFVWGEVHFFVVNSNSSEPDGADSTSVQAQWLRNALSASTSRWKIVYFHQAPYSSGSVHGNKERMQWQFQSWGATAVLAGHEHTYERIILNGFPYFVNGLGGAGRYSFGDPIPGSEVRYCDDHGAMKIVASSDSIQFQFINRQGELIDSYTIGPLAVPSKKESLPKRFFLREIFPNPFRSRTMIQFSLPQDEIVTVKLYNVMGSEIGTVLHGNLNAGIHTVNWEASQLSSGIYYYSLQAGGDRVTRKGVILRNLH